MKIHSEKEEAENDIIWRRSNIQKKERKWADFQSDRTFHIPPLYNEVDKVTGFQHL